MLEQGQEFLRDADPEIFSAITDELERQRNGIELIASENFVSLAVLAAMGSVMTNKYAEGYPHARYYGGCHVVDRAPVAFVIWWWVVPCQSLIRVVTVSLLAPVRTATVWPPWV